MNRVKIRKALLCSLVAASGLSLALSAFGKDVLTLRVNDAIAEPGGLAAVVVRTYASRPAGQGQMCIVAGLAKRGGVSAGAATPFAELVDSVVFASRRDGVSVASMSIGGGGQEIMLRFSSASGTLNATDGPLGVLYFRLRKNVRPGQTFLISIDAANTALFDSAGNPIAIRPRAGELVVRAKSDPYAIEAEGDRVAPGQVASLGLETYEPFAIASGRVAFRYDPAIQGGRVKVRMDKKYGTRRFNVERRTPGLLVVNFRSPRSDLNLVPGQILQVLMPTDPDIPLGRRALLEIDSNLTFLQGPSGEHLPIATEGNSLRFRPGSGGDDDDGDSDGSDDSEDDDGDSDGSDDSEDDDGDSDGGDDSEDDDGDSDGSDDSEDDDDDSDGSDDSGDDSEDDSNGSDESSDDS